MCLDDQMLNTYLDGELQEPFKSQVEEHLKYCAACRGRYLRLEELRRTIVGAALTQEEIAPRQAQVLRVLENTRLNRKRPGFLRRQIRLNLPVFASAAAAFVFVFIGSIFYVNNQAGAFMPSPVENRIDEGNVNLVTDQSKRTIDDYSLEEILDSLDRRGYTYEVKPKVVEPVRF